MSSLFSRSWTIWSSSSITLAIEHVERTTGDIQRDGRDTTCIRGDVKVLIRFRIHCDSFLFSFHDHRDALAAADA